LTVGLGSPPPTPAVAAVCAPPAGRRRWRPPRHAARRSEPPAAAACGRAWRPYRRGAAAAAAAGRPPVCRPDPPPPAVGGGSGARRPPRRVTRTCARARRGPRERATARHAGRAAGRSVATERRREVAGPVGRWGGRVTGPHPRPPAPAGATVAAGGHPRAPRLDAGGGRAGRPGDRGLRPRSTGGGRGVRHSPRATRTSRQRPCYWLAARGTLPPTHPVSPPASASPRGRLRPLTHTHRRSGAPPVWVRAREYCFKR